MVSSGWSKAATLACGSSISPEAPTGLSVLRSIQFWLGLIISLVLMALFLRAIHPSEIADAFGEANYWYLFPAICVLFVALSLRCLRWSILMRPLKEIPAYRLFSYAIIGYMTNNLLPARTGEIVRAYVLGEREKVSRLGTLGTIALERLFDGVALVLCCWSLAPSSALVTRSSASSRLPRRRSSRRPSSPSSPSPTPRSGRIASSACSRASSPSALSTAPRNSSIRSSSAFARSTA